MGRGARVNGLQCFLSGRRSRCSYCRRHVPSRRLLSEEVVVEEEEEEDG